MTDNAAAPVKKARRRGKPIEVWVNDEEKAAITARAEEAGLSRSGYLKLVGLNQPIRSKLDLAAVAEVAKVNADLGRLGGLLKLWLADPDKRGRGARPRDVQAVLDEIRDTQVKMLNIMGEVLRP
ncbi:CopG family transcriptional regulator [Stenotrophomonas sp. GD03993]|uniref:plasmid mobilization protein n=1 Tax=unclassified Stenotrophomonas TaxID=196198 RepID=UPI0024479A6D|nr:MULTISPECIES: CopG family transcriptional regulator [unclassified Stenotrophomonas]MDH0187693.1 CopG family transcriptional regulator [Stenotrophomonas sp. GD04051]MDH0465283.1 CopG family transcriptional regulator [Stenotrophomonas sp. GD03993]MDH0877872.1 CopG family transcriptional regulator [Stenotrophomonas sp. GD03877]